ncbi:MAG: sigma factor [Ruminococcus sp.]
MYAVIVKGCCLVSSQKMSNKQLVLRIKAGENVADNMLQLWQQNQGFIRSIAKKYAAYEEIEDLIQQGYFGMCNAVNGYDPENGVSFLHYASFWIRQSIHGYIEDCGKIVRLPRHFRGS